MAHRVRTTDESETDDSRHERKTAVERSNESQP